MSSARRPDPPPLSTNEYAPVAVITALWGVALVVLGVRHATMAAHGDGWWLWVAVAGFALGLWGLTFVWLRHHVFSSRTTPRD